VNAVTLGIPHIQLRVRPVSVPSTPWTITARITCSVIPRVHRYLDLWADRARAIPDDELRRQALMSIKTKTFHCEGGGIYSVLAGSNGDEAIRFIVAYQTISDYLDNLCDRSTSLDPNDFESLHEAMADAVTPGAPLRDYYLHRNEQEDGGYLADLVKTCQDVLLKVPAYPAIGPHLQELEGYYADLQVHKHVRIEERVERLQKWFESNRDGLPDLRWYEFSASSGSTLGIFALVASSFDPSFSSREALAIKQAYFPWVQGLHILMDYLVDQEEDLLGGDLNFCSYYENDSTLVARLTRFLEEADKAVSGLPHQGFHRLVCHGLLGLYLADRKVSGQVRVRRLARKMIREGGGTVLFFFLFCWVFRRVKRRR
jgi:tetraprenyl-beta-curcumene synthase